MTFRRRRSATQTVHSSIQIWYESDTDDVELDLDINIWRLKKRKAHIFMDFGLKVEKSHAVSKIFIFYPFIFEKKSIQDLGHLFKNPQVLNGIFNKNYSTGVNDENSKNIIVKDNESNGVLFSIYELNVENDCQVENHYGGTLVSFSVNNPQDIDTMYYRFRITTKDFHPFIEHYHPKNTFFESAFIETELLDFRINEKRNQDANLIEKISMNKRFRIMNIHFYVMTSIRDEIVSDGINIIYRRQLEMNDYWKPYLGEEYDRMSVYISNNVKKNAENFIDDGLFSCFAKINYRKSNFFTIIIYLIVVLLITIVFTIVANIIWSKISSINWRSLNWRSLIPWIKS